MVEALLIAQLHLLELGYAAGLCQQPGGWEESSSCVSTVREYDRAIEALEEALDKAVDLRQALEQGEGS